MPTKSITQHANNSSNWKEYSESLRKDGYDLNDSKTSDMVFDAWKTKGGSGLNSGNNGGGGVTGKITNPIDVLNAGRGNSTISEMRSEYDTSVKSLADLINTKALNDDILAQIKKEADLHTIINEKMGMTGELSREFRDIILDTVPKAATLGYDIGNIADMVTRITENSGRFNLISQETMENAMETARAFGMTLPQMAEAMGEFEKVGLGASDTSKSINKAGMQSLSLGLNSKKTTEDLRTNISKLNEYGFSNGIAGLNRMVQQSLEFRMNMAETFKVADKVMNPESAIELTANMQMLGGAIGDLNDPLKLMYMATNNVEGLQDAIQGAASTLATYNKEQGRFEITGANLRRAKEMASQLGVSYGEFAKGAIAAQERISANNTLLTRGLTMNDKDREFLTNLSQMKDGQMQIVVPKSLQESLGKDLGSNEIKLSELSNAQVEILKTYQKDLENKTPAEMAQDMFTSQKNTENYTKGTMLALQRIGKEELFGKQERKNSPLQNLSNLQLKAYREQYNVASSNPQFFKDELKKVKKTSELVKTSFNTGIQALTIVATTLIDNLKKYGTTDPATEEKNKRNSKREEESKAKNNEITIKSFINVVSTGFNNAPIIEQNGTPYTIVNKKK